MAPAGDTQGSLLNRSPRSRKSLAATTTAPALPSTAASKRKRAHSIAPGENLKLDAARRRSLLRPTKGILKPFNPNQADQTQDITQEVSQASQAFLPAPQIASPDNTDITDNVTTSSEFRINVHDNPSRKSLGGRRVSFAAHAHVRVFNPPDQNTNGTSSPASSPASSSSASAPSDPPPLSPEQKSPDPAHHDSTPQLPLRRSSIGRRRRPSVHALHNDEGEGEESMDVSADEIPSPTFPQPSLSSFQPQPPDIGSLPPSGSIHDPNPVEDSDEELDSDDEGDMSMTGEFGPGIVSRRRTMSMAGGDRRKSRMRSSITIPPSEGGTEPKDFTVSVDRPPPPETDAFKALRAIANGNRADDAPADDDDDDDGGEVDMDVTTAMTRLMAVRNSTGGEFQVNNGGDDSFSSTEDSFDGVDTGDRTMNMTNLMGSFRASDYGMEDDGDVTMSATSVVGAPISTRRESVPSVPPFQPAPFIPASTKPVPSLSLPALKKSSGPSAQASSSNANRAPSPAKPPARTASPVKQPIKQFTAAFAPPHPPLKRPLPTSGQDGTSAAPPSPNKKRAIAANESSTRRVSVPVAPAPAENNPLNLASPRKGLPNKARRPSGYYRKSLAGTGTPADPPAASKQFSSSTSAHQRRQSVAPSPRPVSPKKSAAPSTLKPPPALPAKTPAIDLQRGDDANCAREERRQSVALPSPTRGSPSPSSPAVKPRYGGERHVPNLISPVDAVGEDNAHSAKDIHEETPTLSPAPTQSIDPGQWASTVRGEDVPQEDDLAPISVDQFFMMTGIRFMDDLTCPRRSTIHPSQLQRRESNDGEEETYPLSDYAVAMTVDVAQLETMAWIANDIRSAIEKYKAQYQETEEDAAKDIPFLFREYAIASEEDREQILYVLKLIKAHTILSAKASWYEWKRGWVQGLQTNAERALDNLDADERQLADIAKRAGQTLPGLRTEYEEIMRELEQEQAAVAEIENCDQTFLSELKATIAEQRQELDVYRNDIADGNAKLARLEETLEDLEDQAREAKTAITTAQRHMDMQKTSTRAEVFRLRDELSNLQDLHLWRATQLSSEMVEFVYDSKHRVTIPCRRFSPIPEALNVVPFGDHADTNDDFPMVTELMYRIARRRAIQDHHNKLSLRIIIQRLTDFWTSYSQLRWQLNFIVIKYPLSFQLLPTGSGVDNAEGFKATATLLLYKKTSKALISFHFDSEMLSSWPTTMDLLGYEVSVVYGRADPKVVSEALKTRLSEASTAENHACLVDACMEVVSRYS